MSSRQTRTGGLVFVPQIAGARQKGGGSSSSPGGAVPVCAGWVASRVWRLRWRSVAMGAARFWARVVVRRVPLRRRWVRAGRETAARCPSGSVQIPCRAPSASPDHPARTHPAAGGPPAGTLAIHEVFGLDTKWPQVDEPASYAATTAGTARSECDEEPNPPWAYPATSRAGYFSSVYWAISR
jgi:hypothetical protein